MAKRLLAARPHALQPGSITEVVNATGTAVDEQADTGRLQPSMKHELCMYVPRKRVPGLTQLC